MSFVSEQQPPKRPGLWHLIVAAVRYDREQLDADAPVVRAITKRSRRLGAMAGEFAVAGRTDPAAVAALRAAAGRHHKDLRRAAAGFRFDGGAEESRGAYLANQLLLAAATGQPVSEITDEQEDQFRRVDEFLEHHGEEGFAALVALEPRLGELERTINTEVQAAQEEPTDEAREVAIKEIRKHLQDALRPLVGPASDSADPLLRIHLVHQLAYSHLSKSLY